MSGIITADARVNQMARKSGLGRGIDALMFDNSVSESSSVELKISDIEPNAQQPRRIFDDDALHELSENIKQYGLLQPIVVRPLPNGNYQIVAGERRWRASRAAGLKTIPAIIKELDDKQTMEIALIENLQREDLNPIEAAEGYKRLMDNFGMTQEVLSERVGKSRSAIANTLRLLELGDFKKYVESGEISAGHARAIIPLNDTDRAVAIGMIKRGATVRDIEKFVQQTKQPVKKQPEPKDVSRESVFGKDQYLQEVQIALTDALGRRVKVSRTGAEKGMIQVEFYSNKDLESLVHKMFGNI